MPIWAYVKAVFGCLYFFGTSIYYDQANEGIECRFQCYIYLEYWYQSKLNTYRNHHVFVTSVNQSKTNLNLT